MAPDSLVSFTSKIASLKAFILSGLYRMEGVVEDLAAFLFVSDQSIVGAIHQKLLVLQAWNSRSLHYQRK